MLHPFYVGDISKYLTGEISGSAGAKQLPDISCKAVKFKAVSGNAGSVYIGFADTVTVPDGTQDATSGYELDAGQESDWILMGNLNKIWIICDNAGDDLTYLAVW